MILLRFLVTFNHGRLTSLTDCYLSYTLSYIDVSIYTRLWDTALDHSACLRGPNPYLLQIKCQ